MSNKTLNQNVTSVNPSAEILRIVNARADYVREHGDAKGFYSQLMRGYRVTINEVLYRGILASKQERFVNRLLEALPAALKVAEMLDLALMTHCARYGVSLDGVTVDLPVYDPHRPTEQGRSYKAFRASDDEMELIDKLGDIDTEAVESWYEFWKKDLINKSLLAAMPEGLANYARTLLPLDSRENAPAWKLIAAVVKEWGETYQKVNHASPSRMRAEFLARAEAGYNDYQRRYDNKYVVGETERDDEAKEYLVWFKGVEMRFDEVDRVVHTQEFKKLWEKAVKHTEYEYGGRSLLPTFKVRPQSAGELATMKSLLPDYEHFVYVNKETGEMYEDLRKEFASIDEARKQFPVESQGVTAAYRRRKEKLLAEGAAADAKQLERFTAIEVSNDVIDIDEL